MAKLLAPKEVADRLRLPSVGTLYQWRHKGQGPPAFLVGRHLRYDEAELEAWIEARKRAER